MLRDADTPHQESLNCCNPLILDDSTSGNAGDVAGKCAIAQGHPHPPDSDGALSNSLMNQRSSKRLQWSDTELQTFRSEVEQDKDESNNTTSSRYGKDGTSNGDEQEDRKRRHKELLRKAKLERLQERRRRESAAMFNYSRSDYPVREWQFALPFGIQHPVVINPLVTGVSVAWLWGLVIGSAGTLDGVMFWPCEKSESN
jgi:hypothetical protein